MIQGIIGAAIKEVLGGLADSLPKPPIGGNISVDVTFVVKDGKPVLKEGSEIPVTLHLNLGDDETLGDF